MDTGDKTTQDGGDMAIETKSPDSSKEITCETGLSKDTDILEECDRSQEQENEQDKLRTQDSTGADLIEECDIKREPGSDSDGIQGESNELVGNSIPGDELFILDYTIKSEPTTGYRVLISSDSDDSSSDSSSSDESDSSASDADVSEEEKHELLIKVKVEVSESTCNKKKPSNLRTKGELCPEDLPPLEELQITVDDSTEMVELGKISGIVGVLVIVQSDIEKPALNENSVIFMHDRKVLGLVFETFGPVPQPYYSVRFNSTDDIEAKGIEIGMRVLFAPKEDEYTHYVFVKQLLSLKGSDASWEDNNEPPDKYLDYSDDEQERLARKAKKSGGGGGDDDENENDTQKKGRKRKTAANRKQYQENTLHNQHSETERGNRMPVSSNMTNGHRYNNPQFKWPPQERPSLRGRGAYNRFQQPRGMTNGPRPRYLNGHQNQNQFQNNMNVQRHQFNNINNQTNQPNLLNPPTFVHQMQPASLPSPGQQGSFQSALSPHSFQNQNRQQSQSNTFSQNFSNQQANLTQQRSVNHTTPNQFQTGNNGPQQQFHSSVGNRPFPQNMNNQSAMSNSSSFIPSANQQLSNQSMMIPQTFQNQFQNNTNRSQYQVNNANEKSPHQNMSNGSTSLNPSLSVSSFSQQMNSQSLPSPNVFNFNAQKNQNNQTGGFGSHLSRPPQNSFPHQQMSGNNQFRFGSSSFGGMNNRMSFNNNGLNRQEFNNNRNCYTNHTH